MPNGPPGSWACPVEVRPRTGMRCRISSHPQAFFQVPAVRVYGLFCRGFLRGSVAACRHDSRVVDGSSNVSHMAGRRCIRRRSPAPSTGTKLAHRDPEPQYPVMHFRPILRHVRTIGAAMAGMDPRNGVLRETITPIPRGFRVSVPESASFMSLLPHTGIAKGNRGRLLHGGNAGTQRAQGELVAPSSG